MAGWLAGRAGYIKTTNESQRNDNRQLPDKVMTLYKYDMEVKRLKFIRISCHSE
jgi:hypothetical protein